MTPVDTKTKINLSILCIHLSYMGSFDQHRNLLNFLERFLPFDLSLISKHCCRSLCVTEVCRMRMDSTVKIGLQCATVLQLLSSQLW